MKKVVLLFGFFIALLVLASCADNPGGGDNLPPTVTLYTPESGDTLVVGTHEVIYDANDDQGFRKIDLYVNGFFRESFPAEEGERPVVELTVDSTMTGQMISVQLVAYDLGDNQAESELHDNILVLYTLSPPSAPRSVSVTKITDNIVNISWVDTSPGIIEYELWRAQNTSDPAAFKKIKPPPTLGPGTFNTNDELPFPQLVYYYKVRSRNAIGYSGFSAVVNSTGGSGTGSLIAPTNVEAEPLGSQEIRITWRDNSEDENFFKIQRKLSWSSNYTQVGIVPPNTTSFTDDTGGLSSGQDYNYRVGAFTSTDSAYSEPVTAQPYPFDINAPSGLQASYLEASNKVQLTWRDNSIYESENIVERKTGAQGNFTEIVTLGSDVESYDDLNVSSGTMYTYRVRASDGVIYSDYSAEVIIIVP